MRRVSRSAGRAAALVVALATFGVSACRSASAPDVTVNGRYDLMSVASETVPTASAPDGFYRVRSGELVLGPGDRVLRRVWYEPADPSSGNPPLLRIHEGTFSLDAGGVIHFALVDPVAATLHEWRPEGTLNREVADGSAAIELGAGTTQDGAPLIERYVRR
jgi:hypothetical protein